MAGLSKKIEANLVFNRRIHGILKIILAVSIFMSGSKISYARETETEPLKSNSVSSLSRALFYSDKAKNCESLHAYLSGFLPPSVLLLKEIEADLDKIVKRDQPEPGHLEKDRALLSFLHFTSHCYFSTQKIVIKNQRLSWKELIMMINKGPESLYPSKQISLVWINFLRYQTKSFSQLFDVLFLPSVISDHLSFTFIRHEDVLLTPGQASMWQHCQTRFNYKNHGWKANLIAGFMSPAYQFTSFVRQHASLEKSFEKIPPPGFGGHQKAIPDMLIALSKPGKAVTRKTWQMFYETCAEFGIKKAYPDQEKFQFVAQFLGIKSLYRDIFSNPLIPKNISRDLPDALRAADFYPSPKGLKVILALSAQESTMQWNPKLNEQKKSLLRRRFNNILAKINQSIPGSVSSFFLAEAHQKELDKLTEELHHLTDIEHDKTREYDFYLWSRRTFAFIIELKSEYRQMAKVGQWFFDLESLNSRLEKEPQTFGLWQINVNHLQEKIKSFKQLRRAFPEIYQKTNGKWIVNRSWLIDALSGRRQARLSRGRTLELIIHTHLKPHYENHMLGDRNDLMFFIAENMAGEMSTFRAAVQKELNEKMRSSLKTDGDLTYYLPYSTRIDWNRESKTYLKLKEFISNHRYYFDEPVDANKLIRELCQAKSWGELNQLELYKKLLDKDSAVRIFPDIRSNLYNQTPRAYARLVTKKSLLF